MSENQDNRPEDIPAAPAVPSAGPGAAPINPTAGGSIPPQPPAPAAPAAPASAPTDTGATQPYPGQAFGFPAPQARTGPARPDGDKKKVTGGRIAGLLVAAALVGGAAGLGGSWAGANLWAPVDSSSTAGPSVVTVNNPDSVNATTGIAAKVVPSVVTINVSSGNNGGTGSGVVLSKDGYVLTNTHVVTLDGASGDAAISVTTSDGHIYTAKIVGTDPVYDLAVIKLTGASDLTPVTWGDSGKLNVGDQTVAIGAPLGLSNTVTTGIVSALNRSIEIASSAAPKGGSGDGGNGGDNGGSPFFFDFGQGQQQQSQASESIKIAVIQTDAPINPGNSGGALVDGEGKLVGINVAIASTGSTSSSSQSGSIGVGFSIPSDIAHRVADEIIKDGSASHGLLGASVRDASAVQGATITGAYIVDVTSGGGAEKAGLRAGDVVTAFNEVPVGSAVDLTAQVRAAAAGSKATVTYVRDGRTATADVTLGSLK
ncbi:S1C family serine protease [Microbacterium elymi]|uniref:Trypsin-like peptidase domain-containing protein n=1 Tax=Microbacterium elymi TaxID=2909587 RepID=A0ABY5NK91_9MICO|nr:trypsin-like peptidase domain-containing protein [Microbacterium elymi]UUT35501.1 trypsin-like peptidase domain-containing protein [Microbacterium elymi]